MRYLILFFILILTGCASLQTPRYISRVDHPYDRKFYASFEKVVISTMYVLKKRGWIISEESEPSMYERDDRYDNNGYQNLLIITNARKNALHMTSIHLNVFIHSMANTCDVEIRYEARTPLVKQFIFARNDRMVKGILDALEKDVNG